MILLVHLLFGAAIGSVVKNVPLAIILAFLSHYFLDLLPHIEYPIENIEKKQWRKAIPDILKVVLDFCLGILLVLIFSKNQPIIYICAIFTILSDGLTILNYFVPNKILAAHDRLHQKIIHFLKFNPVECREAAISPWAELFNRVKKIPNFWRVVSQIAVVIISIVLLRV